MSEFTSEQLELYPVFKVHKYKIGSTQYKIEECSPVITQVYIKTSQDKYRFRAIKDFFGLDAHIEAYRFVQEQMSN